MVLGIVMVALAALRFLSTAKSIDSAEIQPRTGGANGSYPCGSVGVAGLRSLFLSLADYRVEHPGALTIGGSSDAAAQ